MAKRKLQSKRILLTGASSGIGYALAQQLVAAGNDILVVARREDRLLELQEATQECSGTIHCLAGDITCGDFRAEMIQWVDTKWDSTLDVLINNAGIGSHQAFANSKPEYLRQIMDVNVIAPLELIRGHLQHLRRAQSPVICNVGSVLGHVAMPGNSEYCASKFALHGFSDALRAELSNEKIDVVLVSPSTTRTEFFDSLLAGPQASKSGKGMSVQVVARKIVRAIEKGTRESILSWTALIGIWQDRIFPSLTSWQLTRWYHRNSK
jgi:short-subunit dehydrogenase